MTATSVGITVETLKELGKLKSEVGTIIVSAAILDDVVGIVILTVFMSLAGSGSAISSPVLSLINPDGIAVISILWMLVYFVVAIVGGVLISKLFNYIAKRHPDTHRIPVYSIVVCFLYAVVAEAVFGVADITGAYIAGVILSTNHRNAEYVDKKVSVSSFMFFGPIFFANIGEDAKVYAFALAEKARGEGLRAQSDLMGRSLKAQMKYADKVKAKYTVVLGDDEVANKTAVAKNMLTKEQITLDLTKSIREQLK